MQNITDMEEYINLEKLYLKILFQSHWQVIDIGNAFRLVGQSHLKLRKDEQ